MELVLSPGRNEKFVISVVLFVSVERAVNVLGRNI